MPILNMIGIISLIVALIMVVVCVKLLVTAMAPVLFKSVKQIENELDTNRFKRDFFTVQQTMRWRFK